MTYKKKKKKRCNNRSPRVRTKVWVSLWRSGPVSSRAPRGWRGPWGTDPSQGRERPEWRRFGNVSGLTGWTAGDTGSWEKIKDMLARLTLRRLFLAFVLLCVLRCLPLPLLGEQTIRQFPGAFAYPSFSSLAFRELMLASPPAQGDWEDQRWS